MRILFTCGGTGGHINPAIAVAKLVREKKAGAEILFLGVEGGMETRLVPQAGFDIRTIEMTGISREKSLSGILKNIKTIKKLLSAERNAAKILRDFSPDVVLGTGGYACFPAIRAASRLGIPTLLHESNAYPGLVTRVLAKSVDCVLLNFESGRKFVSRKAICKVVGNPIRGDLLMYDRKTAREELGLGPDEPLLVSFWGSLGAREMNKHIAQVIKLEDQNKDTFRHIHATGKFGYKWMPEYISSLGVNVSQKKNIVLREYIDDMPRILSAADLVMCRGGAGTLSELCALCKPSIIVPSPNVADNHQAKNAHELEVAGGAVVLEESKVTPDGLYLIARKLLGDEKRRNEMSRALGKLSVLDAAEKIYSEIVSASK